MSPETRKRKNREKVARCRAKMTDVKRAEVRAKNALQQKTCRVNWSEGRKAIEGRANTRNRKISRYRLKKAMETPENDVPAEVFSSRQAEGKAFKKVNKMYSSSSF